jgi:hypothetical protein
MKFQGTTTIRASREAVYDFLVDPNQVTQCAPGVQKVEVTSPEAFVVIAGIGFGMVKVTFNNKVTWTAMDRPSKAEARVHGDAPSGALDATAAMHLSDGDDGATLLTWEADVNLAGQIASLASRMMQPMAKQLTGQFFDCVRKKIER